VVHRGYDGIDPAVTVKVTKSTATVPRGRQVDESSRFRKGLPFSACADVPKNRVGLLGLGPGRMRCGDMTARDKEVFPSIVVKVVKCGAEACHTQAFGTQTAAVRDFDKV